MCSLLTTLQGMQETLRLLVGQVTTSIAQRNEGVPVRVVLILVGVMAIIILSLIGFDISKFKDVVP